jgi:hypothetical protein
MSDNIGKYSPIFFQILACLLRDVKIKTRLLLLFLREYSLISNYDLSPKIKFIPQSSSDLPSISKIFYQNSWKEAKFFPIFAPLRKGGMLVTAVKYEVRDGLN